ncbi:MAG: hypothetical protein IJL87_04950 [Clostridia bacterium]|nr:hypothetical protein [Clostridia bacterium]
MSREISLHDIDVHAFLRVLDTCKDDVYLITDEGDKLNLRSRLCQLIGLAKLIEGGKIAKASVICNNMEDESKLFRYNLYRD